MVWLQQVLDEAQKNNRVCPKVALWAKLWDELLPDKEGNGRGGWNPPLPLILGALWHTGDRAKQERLREHIDWADEHGVLEAVYDFLKNIKEKDWIHVGQRYF